MRMRSLAVLLCLALAAVSPTPAATHTCRQSTTKTGVPSDAAAATPARRPTLRRGDLDAKQAAAARRVFVAALSACGLELMDEVRRADDFLVPFDKRPIGWGGGNY